MLYHYKMCVSSAGVFLETEIKLFYNISQKLSGRIWKSDR